MGLGRPPPCLSTARRDTYPSRPRGENVTDIIFRIRPGVGVGVGADQEPGVGVGVWAGPALPRLRNPAFCHANRFTKTNYLCFLQVQL